MGGGRGKQKVLWFTCGTFSESSLYKRHSTRNHHQNVPTECWRCPKSKKKYLVLFFNSTFDEYRIFFLNKTKSMYPYSSKTILSGAIFTELSYGRVLWAINLLLFWGSKITADGDCSREIKGRLLLRSGRAHV